MGRNKGSLNVLMVTARYFPYIGGIETHVYEVARRLVQLGINITILTTMPYTADSQSPFSEIVDGVRIIRVRSWPSHSDYYIAPEMITIIKQGTWDLVHCQGCHTFVPPLAMLAAKAARIPYVVTFHTGGHSSGFRNSIRSIQWKLLRPLLTNALRLIGVSHFEANYFRDLLHLPETQFVVIHNGASLPDIKYSFSVPSKQTLIVSIGRLERYKGHQRLIMALPKLLEWRSDVQLLILGAGPYEAALRELIKRIGVAEFVEIRSVPASDRLRMAEVLSQASLVALLSEYEAHPIAVMEALSLHRPVLVTDTSGFKELAKQKLVRSIPLESSPIDIALAAREQIENPIASLEDFILPDWDDCASQLHKIYEESIRKKQCVY